MRDRRTLLPLFLLFVARAAIAQVPPTLVGLTPVNGPSSGGTVVTVTITPGTFPCGIDPCTGAVLMIGGVEIPYEQSNSTTLIAVTPPHSPGPVDVELKPGIGGIGTPSVLPNAFTYLAAVIPALSNVAIVLLSLTLAVSGAVLVRRR